MGDKVVSHNAGGGEDLELGVSRSETSTHPLPLDRPLQSSDYYSDHSQHDFSNIDGTNNENNQSQSELLPDYLTSDFVPVSPPQQDNSIDHILHISIDHQITCQLHPHQNSSNEDEKAAQLLSSLFPFSTATYIPFSSQFAASALKAPFNQLKHVEVGSRCLFFPYKPVSLGFVSFGFLPPLSSHGRSRFQLFNDYPYHILYNARTPISIPPSLASQLAGAPNNVGIATQTARCSTNYYNIISSSTAPAMTVAQNATQGPKWMETKVVTGDSIGEIGLGNLSKANSIDSNTSHDSKDSNSTNLNGIAGEVNLDITLANEEETKTIVWDGNEFNQFIAITHANLSPSTHIPTQASKNNPRVIISPTGTTTVRPKAKRGRKSKAELALLKEAETQKALKLASSLPPPPTEHEPLMRFDPLIELPIEKNPGNAIKRGFNQATNAYNVSTFTEFALSHFASRVGDSNGKICIECAKYCAPLLDLPFETPNVSIKGTKPRQEHDVLQLLRRDHRFLNTIIRKALTTDSNDLCECFCHDIDTSYQDELRQGSTDTQNCPPKKDSPTFGPDPYVNSSENSKSTLLKNEDVIADDNRRTENEDKPPLQSEQKLAGSTQPSERTQTPNRDLNFVPPSCPPPRNRITPEEIQFLSLSCMVPFSLLSVTAISYFHARATPGREFDVITSLDYGSEVVSSSFAWLISQLKRPITFSSTLIEFDTSQLPTFFPNSTPPDCLLLSDTASHRFQHQKIRYRDENDTETDLPDPVESLVPLDKNIHHFHPENLAQTGQGMTADLMTLCASVTGWKQDKVMDDSVLGSYYPQYKMTPEIELYQNRRIAMSNPHSTSTLGKIPQTAEEEREEYFRLSESLFPYDIKEEHLAIWRAFLFHLEILSPLHRFRLFRHAHCIYSVYPRKVRNAKPKCQDGNGEEDDEGEVEQEEQPANKIDGMGFEHPGKRNTDGFDNSQREQHFIPTTHPTLPTQINVEACQNDRDTMVKRPLQPVNNESPSNRQSKKQKQKRDQNGDTDTNPILLQLDAKDPTRTNTTTKTYYDSHMTEYNLPYPNLSLNQYHLLQESEIAGFTQVKHNPKPVSTQPSHPRTRQSIRKEQQNGDNFDSSLLKGGESEIADWNNLLPGSSVPCGDSSGHSEQPDPRDKGPVQARDLSTINNQPNAQNAMDDFLNVHSVDGLSMNPLHHNSSHQQYDQSHFQPQSLSFSPSSGSPGLDQGTYSFCDFSRQSSSRSSPVMNYTSFFDSDLFQSTSQNQNADKNTQPTFGQNTQQNSPNNASNIQTSKFSYESSYNTGLMSQLDLFGFELPPIIANKSTHHDNNNSFFDQHLRVEKTGDVTQNSAEHFSTISSITQSPQFPFMMNPHSPQYLRLDNTNEPGGSLSCNNITHSRQPPVNSYLPNSPTLGSLWSTLLSSPPQKPMALPSCFDVGQHES
jgi:hypothetical protein